MKKSALFYTVLIVLCLAILLAGVSGKVCPKKSFVCSFFTFFAAADTDAKAIEPDITCSKAFFSPDLLYDREFLSSVFHPPKRIS